MKKTFILKIPLFSILILFCLFSLEARSLEVPFLSARVVDEAGLLPAKVEDELSQYLSAYEKKSGQQIVVLTLDSLEGEVLEEYSIKVVEKWQLGKKGQDNGVLIFIAKTDRKLRIEVGYGLEGILTDLKSNRIIQNIIVPHFKQGSYARGIVAGTQAVVQTLDGQFEPPTKSVVKRSAKRPSLLIFFILFFFFILRLASRGPFSRSNYYGSGGRGFGGGGFSGGGGSFGGGGSSGSW